MHSRIRMMSRRSRLTKVTGSSPASSSVRPGVFIRPLGALTRVVVDVLVRVGVQEAWEREGLREGALQQIQFISYG